MNIFSGSATFVLRAIRAVRAAVLYNQAVNQASQRRYDAAMLYMIKAYDLLGDSMPSTVASPDINVMLALVASRTKSWRLTSESIEMAMRQLDGSSTLFSEYDKDYLRYFCKIIIEYSEFYGSGSFSTPEVDVKLNYETLRLSAVEGDLKSRFPIARPATSELH